MMRARIDGLVFEGGSGSAEFSIEEDGLRGWFEGVSVRRDSTPRPSSHGDFPSRGYRGGRMITLRGDITSDGPQKQEHLFGRLTGLLGDGQTGRLVVDNAGESKWADVQLDDAPEITQVIYGKHATYRLQLWAVDPLRYGETREFGSGVSAHHYGNAPSFPTLEVTGVYPAGYTVTAGDKSYVVSQALAGGQTHRIEMRTGALYRNGVRQIGGVSSASLWSVQPGQGLVHSLSGSGSLTVKVTDAWN